ncbi:hypothetical protein A6U89_32300 [Agrobacterium sp. B133/95]|nr:hypothetical protein A6U89_32300 [Agrobacterium sp. B133/95]
MTSPIGQFAADGAYDGDPTYEALGRRSADLDVVIPPRSSAIDRSDRGIASQRDRHIAAIRADGRMKWQALDGRDRYRSLQIDHRRLRLRARSFGVQQAEVAIGCAILNRM